LVRRVGAQALPVLFYRADPPGVKVLLGVSVMRVLRGARKR